MLSESCRRSRQKVNIMFCVYGRSLLVARKQIDKQVINRNSETSVTLREMKDSSQTEKQAYIDAQIQQYFERMKPKRCTHEFSTPEIAQEAYQMMKKDTENFGDLLIMKKQEKKHKGGKVVLSKTTKKPLMEWVPLHQVEIEEQEVA